MATCDTRVGAGTITWTCDLDPGHPGPCRAKEDHRSVRERAKWEAAQEEQRQAHELMQAHGVPDKTVSLSEDPSKHPEAPLCQCGSQRIRPIQPAHEGMAICMSCQVEGPWEDFLTPNQRQERARRPSVPPPPPISEEPSIEDRFEEMGVDPRGFTESKFIIGYPPGCLSCQADDHAHCSYIEDNRRAVDAEDFIPSMCPCFNQNPTWHEDLDRTTDEEPTKQREGDQPLPTKNDSPYMQDLVIADIEERKAVGVKRYGTPLQAHNGRDVLQDIYEELLDAAVYMRQLMYERDNPA